ncbi:MAG: hypothetical protein PWQ55_832 [Chloroflexota bacterium]|nr:hypothetical protein [Chloroflexota bacterium]
MRKQPLLLCLLLLASLFVGTAFTPRPQSAVTVSGRVSNGTPGGELPAEATVTLQSYTDSSVGDEYTAPMQPDGSFTFSGLDSEVGNSFVVYVQYLGVYYNSVEMLLQSGANPGADVVIYETSDDPADISITDLYLLVYPGDETYQITEVYRVENSGERTYIGRETSDGLRTTFDWTPPEGAQNIEFSEIESGERFIASSRGFSDTYPIRPTPYYTEVDIAYDLPFADEVTYTNTFAYPLDSVVISGNLTDILITGDGISESQLPEEQDYLNGVYAGGPFAAGDPLTFTIRYSPNAHPPAGSTAAAATEGLTFDGNTLIMGLAALVLAVFLSVMLFRQPRLPDCPADIQPTVDELAALEAEHASGRISGKNYQTQKKKLTAALQRQADRFLSHTN